MKEWQTWVKPVVTALWVTAVRIEILSLTYINKHLSSNYFHHNLSVVINNWRHLLWQNCLKTTQLRTLTLENRAIPGLQLRYHCCKERWWLWSCTLANRRNVDLAGGNVTMLNVKGMSIFRAMIINNYILISFSFPFGSSICRLMCLLYSGSSHSPLLTWTISSKPMGVQHMHHAPNALHASSSPASYVIQQWHS